MKCEIINHEYYNVELPFAQRVKGHIIDKSYGVLVDLSAPGFIFQIEISPFQGFLDTSMEQAFGQFQLDLQKIDIPHGLSFMEYIEFFNQYKLTPSSFFAFLQIIDQWLNVKCNKEVIKMNQLFSFDQFAEKKYNFDPKTKVKFKVFRQSVEDIVEALAPFDTLIYKNYFRIDMNGSWDSTKLNQLWEALEDCEKSDLIDYFEEPLEHYESYQKINQKIPIMHEECFHQYLKAPDQALGLVYKPSQVNWPNPIPKRLVISSCWEGPHGLSVLKRMATLFADEFHGLSAHIQYP